MKPDKRNNNNPNGGGSNNRRNAFGLVSIVLWALFLTLLFRGCMSSYENANTVTVPYTTFREWLVEDKIQTAVIDSSQITFTLKDGVEVELPQSEQSDTSSQTQELMQSLIPTRQQDPNEPVQYVTVRLSGVLDDELMSLLTQYLRTEDGEYAYTEPADSSLYLLNLFLAYVLPVLVMVGLFWFLFRGVGGKGGIGGMGNLGKSNAKVYVEKKTGVTFLDVAGQDEAKESLQEIIDILHNPQKYTEIGAKLPKGALLVGPPGTGKTLLAKAVAGEAGVPFFSISGSDFVEMFVGMGAARVRDLFKEAAKMAPCIIFIDEIDTIGKSRDNRMGGNDEREQTLNQLLAELDGFDPGKGIIVLGATNRPEVLDKALLRPGRFDRRITIDRPNLAGRLATLQVHTRKIKLSEDVDLKKIALATAGCVGADLANLVNEAALRAVRHGRRLVTQEDLLASFEFVIAGSEKKNSVLTEFEKKLVAYHEVGHAMVAYKQKNAEPVQKITIVPHTEGSLGARGGQDQPAHQGRAHGQDHRVHGRPCRRGGGHAHHDQRRLPGHPGGHQHRPEHGSHVRYERGIRHDGPGFGPQPVSGRRLRPGLRPGHRRCHGQGGQGPAGPVLQRRCGPHPGQPGGHAQGGGLPPGEGDHHRRRDGGYHPGPGSRSSGRRLRLHPEYGEEEAPARGH